jgi:hypothetical protein
VTTIARTDDAVPTPNEAVKEIVRTSLARPQQPSAWELVEEVDRTLGPKAKWHLVTVLEELSGEGQLSLFPSKPLTRAHRDYLRSLLDSGDIDAAMKGAKAPRHSVESTIDALVRHASAYRTSVAFREMLDFMANFRDYAPFNNMLIRLQNPTCSFFATAADWKRRFNRQLKDDARPMLILAPKHPVMLMYALDATEGPPLPQELQRLSRFEGDWQSEWLSRTVTNAARDHIAVHFKTLSESNSGFAQIRFEENTGGRLRIVVHDELDEPSRYGVLCHELAHIYLGHLGAGDDGWWPARPGLRNAAIEFEAEAVAYVVTGRLGLQGSSAAYLSRYFADTEIPQGSSLDLIAKVAGRLEQMAKDVLPARAERPVRRRRA